jgi:hypothetical protein
MRVIVGRKPGFAEFGFDKFIKRLQPVVFNQLYPLFKVI